MIIDPTGLSAVEWCNRVSGELSSLVSPFPLRRERDWKIWARNVVRVPAVSAVSPPNPDAFEDWRDWAFRFNQAIYSLTGD